MTSITLLKQRRKDNCIHLQRRMSSCSPDEQTKLKNFALDRSKLESRNTTKQERKAGCQYSYIDQLWHFVFKIDTLVLLAMIVYAYSNDTFISDVAVNLFESKWLKSSNISRDLNSVGFIGKSFLQCRALVELANLIIQGVVERILILPLVTYLDEANITSAIRFTPLPDTKVERYEKYREASEIPAPFLHNKNAILMNLIVLLPLEYGNLLTNFAKGEVEMTSATSISSKQLCQSLLFGLLIIDLILGTAHKISHRGTFKCYLWPFHARHHTQYYNYASVKFCGEPFDLEVFLTQFCYAFLPRILGMDVLTGMILVNAFSIQLLVEHTGYRCFYLSYFHEAHHRYGSVAFYHFPVWELLFGKMPSLSQFRSLCSSRKK